MADSKGHGKDPSPLRSTLKKWARGLKPGRSTSQSSPELSSRPPSSLQSGEPSHSQNQTGGVGPNATAEKPSELPLRTHNQGEVPLIRVESGSTADTIAGALKPDDQAVPRPVTPDNADAEEQILGSLAIEIWNGAFQVVKNGKNMGQLLQEYETQLKETLARDVNPPNDAITTRQSWDSESMKKWLVMVGKAQNESEKHKTAKDTTLGVLGVVKGLSSFVASMLSQSPPAAMVWAGVCAAIPIITMPLEEDEKMASGLKYICERAPMYFSLPDQLLRGANRDEVLARTGQSIRATVQGLYRHTIEYVILSVCSIHRRRFRRVWQALSGQTEWETRLESIEKTEQALSRDNSMFQMSHLLFRVDDFMDFYKQTQYRAEANAKKEKRDQFLNSLSGTGYKERLLATTKRVEGTCQWFCENRKFHDWLHGSGGLLLVSADAGCGKSVLSRYLVEDVLAEHDPVATICYFLFKEDDPGARSFTNAAKALLHNLLESNEELADCWREKLCHDSDRLKGLRQLWSTFFEASTSTSAGSVVCVLDALDESDQGELQAFVDCLREYVFSKPRDSRPKFLLTTRGYPQILNKFNRISHITVSLDGNDDDEMASRSRLEQEINHVTEDRLVRLFEQRQEDIGEKAKRIIQVGMSQKGSKQATYLWMHLMFEVLEKTYPCNLKDWNTLFEGPPGDISQAYEKLLRHVNPLKKNAIRATLGLIIVASHPLSPGELLMALNARDNFGNPRSSVFYEDLLTPKEFISWLRRECGSFVSVFAGRVYLIHLTAREFLTTAKNESASHSSTSLWQGSIVESQAHRHMTESCVVFLSLDEFHISSSSLPPRKEVVARCALSANGTVREDRVFVLHPFTTYAQSNFWYHFKMCQHRIEGYASEKVVDIGEAYIEIFYALFRREDSELVRKIFSNTKCTEDEDFEVLLEYSLRNGLELSHSYQVMFLACLFDNLHLLKFALNEWEQDVKPKGPILDSNTSRTEPDFLHCLPLLAAQANAELCIRHLHVQGFDMEVPGPGGKTPLHIAANAGHSEVMTALVGFGVSTTTLDERNMTALVAAMGNSGGQQLVRGLLASKHDRDDQLHSLLFYASVFEDMPSRSVSFRFLFQRMAKEGIAERSFGFLVDEGANIEYRFQENMDMTALHISVLRGSRYLSTKALLRLGADYYAIDRQGNMPMHTAAVAGNVSGLRRLIDHGASLDTTGCKGDTPLHMACRGKHAKAAEFLARRGADLEIRNEEGLTAIELYEKLHGIEPELVIRDWKKARAEALEAIAVAGRGQGKGT